MFFLSVVLVSLATTPQHVQIPTPAAEALMLLSSGPGIAQDGVSLSP